MADGPDMYAEAERMIKRLDETAYIITLEIKGQRFTSPELAEKISSLGISGVSHIVFVIGGSHGLASSVCIHSNLAVSFSDMTFPHQMMRVILLEQIYRCYRIINNEPYHK